MVDMGGDGPDAAGSVSKFHFLAGLWEVGKHRARGAEAVQADGSLYEEPGRESAKGS